MGREVKPYPAVPIMAALSFLAQAMRRLEHPDLLPGRGRFADDPRSRPARCTRQSCARHARPHGVALRWSQHDATVLTPPTAGVDRRTLLGDHALFAGSGG